MNVISGVLVGGGWCYQLFGWSREVLGIRKKDFSNGVLTGRSEKGYEDEDE